MQSSTVDMDTTITRLLAGCPASVLAAAGPGCWRHVWRSRADVLKLTRAQGAGAYLKILPHGTGDRLSQERDAYSWLADKVPVPRVLAYADGAEAEYLLSEELPGRSFIDAAFVGHSRMIAHGMASALRQLHAVPIRDCPFCYRADTMIRLAKERVERGLVDLDDLNPGNRGQTAQQLYDRLLALRPASEDLVLTHGDYCLPNILIHDNVVSGFIDMGRAGIADRYLDLALGARSLRYNGYSEDAVAAFYGEYGISSVDHRRVGFYILLDEFF